MAKRQERRAKAREGQRDTARGGTARTATASSLKVIAGLSLAAPAGAALGAEHTWGARLRTILEGASDAWLDRAVAEARGPLVRRLVERYLHFDWHAPIIARGLAHPGLLALCGLGRRPEWGRP